MTNELIYTLTGIFILCWLFQLLFQLRFILKTAIIKNEVQSNEQPPLSVIICAKNEAENLEKHLPHVLVITSYSIHYTKLYDNERTVGVPNFR